MHGVGVDAFRVVGQEPCDDTHRVEGAECAAGFRKHVAPEQQREETLLGRVEEVAKLHTTPWLGQKTMQRRLEDAHVPAVFMPTS